MMNGGMLVAYDLDRRKWLKAMSETRSPPRLSTVRRLTHGVDDDDDDIFTQGN